MLDSVLSFFKRTLILLKTAVSMTFVSSNVMNSSSLILSVPHS